MGGEKGRRKGKKIRAGGKKGFFLRLKEIHVMEIHNNTHHYYLNHSLFPHGAVSRRVLGSLAALLLRAAFDRGAARKRQGGPSLRLGSLRCGWVDSAASGSCRSTSFQYLLSSSFLSSC